MSRQRLDDDDLPEMIALRDDRERAFACNYLACNNATLAAMEAGYSRNNKDAAAVTASRLMGRQRMKEAIAALARHHMGSRGSAISLNALLETAADPTHPQRVKAAKVIWDAVNPPTLKLEHTHSHKSDDEMIERTKELSLKLGVPIANMLGPNRVGGPEWTAFDTAWRERWSHLSEDQLFDHLCLVVAELGPSYANAVFGPFMTDTQKAKLQVVLADPRHMLKRLPPIIDAEVTELEAADENPWEF